jgi:ABC-type phosphate/phosphonate transport system ATPase subunit
VYTRNDTDPQRKEIGLIAQEVELIVPELVLENNNGKSLSYGNITALLIEAIKEQQVQIEELKKKLY